LKIKKNELNLITTYYIKNEQTICMFATLLIRLQESNFLRLFKMNEDEVEGKSKQGKGKIREGIGEMTGDTSEELKGKGEQAKGKLQEKWGEAKRKAD